MRPNGNRWRWQAALARLYPDAISQRAFWRSYTGATCSWAMPVRTPEGKTDAAQ